MEVMKAKKKMRMLYAHTFMYKCKMDEIKSPKLTIDEPFEYPCVNRKKDKDWIYF